MKHVEQHGDLEITKDTSERRPYFVMRGETRLEQFQYLRDARKWAEENNTVSPKPRKVRVLWHPKGWQTAFQCGNNPPQKTRRLAISFYKP